MLVRRGEEVLDKLEEESKNAVLHSEAFLEKLIRDNKDTEYGKRYNFSQIHSTDDFKKMVPLSVYDDYAGYIERMFRNGERNLITAYPIRHYALTSGSVNNPKHIPVSDMTLQQFSDYFMYACFGAASRHVAQKEGRELHHGKALFSLEVGKSYAGDGLTSGAISSAAMIYHLKDIAMEFGTSPSSVVFPTESMNQKYLKLRFALPERKLSVLWTSFMTNLVDTMRYLEMNWEMLVNDIERGTIDESIKMSDKTKKELAQSIKPDPERAAELREIFSANFEKPVIPLIWPDIDFIAAVGGGGFSIYTDKMRHYSGDVPIHYLIYAASEAMIAVATEMEKCEYTLIPDSAFYEFIPMDTEDKTSILTIGELEVGKEYELVLTNTSGFYRYRMGDIIRVVGYQNQLPKICFVYRKNQMVNIAGEKTNEGNLTWAVKEFSDATGCDILDYSVYADLNTSPGRYVMLMEPRRRISEEKRAEYRDIIEEKLGIANPSFGSKIKSGVLNPLVLHFLQQETYYLYRDIMVMKGASENQLKPVRVIDTPVKEKFFFSLTEQ